MSQVAQMRIMSAPRDDGPSDEDVIVVISDDTGGHICQGLHIRCQSDSTDINEHVAYLRATAPHPSQPLLYLKAVLVQLHSSIGK